MAFIDGKAVIVDIDNKPVGQVVAGFNDCLRVIDLEGQTLSAVGPLGNQMSGSTYDAGLTAVQAAQTASTVYNAHRIFSQGGAEYDAAKIQAGIEVYRDVAGRIGTPGEVPGGRAIGAASAVLSVHQAFSHGGNDVARGQATIDLYRSASDYKTGGLPGVNWLGAGSAALNVHAAFQGNNILAQGSATMSLVNAAYTAAGSAAPIPVPMLAAVNFMMAFERGDNLGMRCAVNDSIFKAVA